MRSNRSVAHILKLNSVSFIRVNHSAEVNQLVRLRNSVLHWSRGNFINSFSGIWNLYHVHSTVSPFISILDGRMCFTLHMCVKWVLLRGAQGSQNSLCLLTLPYLISLVWDEIAAGSWDIIEEECLLFPNFQLFPLLSQARLFKHGKREDLLQHSKCVTSWLLLGTFQDHLGWKRMR